MAEIIAKRYGQALFDLATENNSHETVSVEAEMLQRIWLDQSDLREVMSRPEISREKKREIWRQVLEGRISTELLNLLFLLTDKGRLPFLPEILTVYEELRMEQAGEVTAYVTSASALNPEQQDRLRETLSKRLSKEVSLSIEVDESLLGGLIVRIQDSLFDSSVKSRMEKLTRNLKNKNLKDEAI